MATHIDRNGVTTTVTPKNGKKFTLAEAQGLVGGYVQMVPIGPKRFLLVDEDGRPKGLPLNSAASTTFGMMLVGHVLCCEKGEF